MIKFEDLIKTKKPKTRAEEISSFASILASKKTNSTWIKNGFVSSHKDTMNLCLHTIFWLKSFQFFPFYTIIAKSSGETQNNSHTILWEISQWISLHFEIKHWNLSWRLSKPH